MAMNEGFDHDFSLASLHNLSLLILRFWAQIWEFHSLKKNPKSQFLENVKMGFRSAKLSATITCVDIVQQL
jgi:hypothetical protein